MNITKPQGQKIRLVGNGCRERKLHAAPRTNTKPKLTMNPQRTCCAKRKQSENSRRLQRSISLVWISEAVIVAGDLRVDALITNTHSIFSTQNAVTLPQQEPASPAPVKRTAGVKEHGHITKTTPFSDISATQRIIQATTAIGKGRVNKTCHY